MTRVTVTRDREPEAPSSLNHPSGGGGAGSRKRRTIRYLWVVGLLLYVLVVWIVGFGKLRETLAGANLGILALVAGIELTAQWVRALKWRLVLGPRSRGVGLFFLSRCAGFWMPMRMGELSPLLLKAHRTPKVAAWIVVDRMLEIGTTLGLGALGVLVLKVRVEGTLAAVAVAGCVFVVAPFFVLTQRRLFLALAERFGEGSRARRGLLFLADIRGEVVALGPRMPLASAMTFAAGALDVAGGMALYACFGFGLPFALVAAVKCTHALTSAIPLTPNATGIPFVTAGLLLNQVGGVPAHVVATAVPLYIVLVNVIFYSMVGIAATDLWRQLKEVE